MRILVFLVESEFKKLGYKALRRINRFFDTDTAIVLFSIPGQIDGFDISFLHKYNFEYKVREMLVRVGNEKEEWEEALRRLDEENSEQRKIKLRLFTSHLTKVNNSIGFLQHAIATQYHPYVDFEALFPVKNKE